MWIEECGHVPHLEKPAETADAILNFVETGVVAKTSSSRIATTIGGTMSTEGTQPTYIVGAGFFGAMAFTLLQQVISQY